MSQTEKNITCTTCHREVEEVRYLAPGKTGAKETACPACQVKLGITPCCICFDLVDSSTLVKTDGGLKLCPSCAARKIAVAA